MCFIITQENRQLYLLCEPILCRSYGVNINQQGAKTEQSEMTVCAAHSDNSKLSEKCRGEVHDTIEIIEK